MSYLYLIRHCQSIANVKRIYNGEIEEDEGLSPHGIKQAETLGKYFEDKEISLIIASPFKRTRQTADFISRYAPRAKVEFDHSIREHECGKWNGKKETEIKKKFPMEWAGWRFDPQNNPIPEGESLFDIQSRALPTIQRTVTKNKGKNIAVVTHYCIFNVILCSLISNISNFRCFDTQNAMVAKLEVENVPRLLEYEKRA
jgi:probable phosphoglycerate mutase